MTFDARGQIVTCSDCLKRYCCTPEQDYYHQPHIPAAVRTVENGVCWDCLLEQNGMTPQPESSAPTVKGNQ